MTIDPPLIPSKLVNVYAPGEYDSNRSVLACNFPTGTTIEECSNFMSSIGPVVFVDNAPSVQLEANFVVVYSTPEFAIKSTREELVFNEGCQIFCRFVDEKPTIWENISNFIQGIDQYGASDQISSFINDTAAPAFYSTKNQVNERIQSIASSDLSNQVIQGFNDFSNQVKDSVSYATGALYSSAQK